MPEQDKDPRVQENPDDQRTVPEVTGDARSAFRPLRDNGGLSPFMLRPRPQQTDLHAQSSQIRYNQTSQTSWRSSSNKRNAISSSYSSTGGLPGLKQRRGPASSRCQLTLSYPKKLSEDRPQAVSSGHTRCEKVADTAPGQTLAPRGGSPRSQDSRPRRRKIPLLPPRRGEPLMLPPPLELGYRVMAKDLHLEKEAAFQRINSAPHVEDKAISDCRPSQPSHTLSSLATGASGGPPVSKAPTMDAQQDRPKSQDCLGLVAPLASAAEVPCTAPVSGKKHRPPGPLFSSSDPLPATSTHYGDSAQVTSLISAPFTAASRDAGMRRTRPGTSAPAAAAAAPPSSTLNPTSGSLLNAVDGGPLHFSASATAAAGAQRSEVRYKQRSQTSRTRSCRKRNASSSSHSSTEGLPELKRRRGPASSRCQLAHSSSKTVREDGPQDVSSAHNRYEKKADTAPGQTLAPRGGSPRSQASRPRMDSAPHVEDKAISDCRPSRPSHTLSSLATGASGGPPVSKAPTMDAQQDRPKSQDCLGLVAPLASAAEVPSTAPVSGKKHRPGGPLFSSSDPLPPATSSHSRDSAQVTSMIPAPFTAASRDARMRRTRPGMSAPAAAAAAPPPSTWIARVRLLNAVDGSPSYFWASATAAAGAQRSEVRYKQRSQTSRTRSCRKRNASSSSHSSTEGLPELTRRRGPASSRCQLAHSSSKTVREDGPQDVSSGHNRYEKKADTAPGQTLAPRGGSPRSQASRPRIDSAPHVEDKAISDCRPSRPSHTLSSLATGASGGPPVSKAPTVDAQQDRPKSQDCLGLVAPLASAAEVPSTAPVSGKKHRPAGSLFSSSDPLPATSSHSRDSAQVTSLTPAPFTPASRDADMRRMFCVRNCLRGLGLFLLVFFFFFFAYMGILQLLII
ncbi:putative POM121-like protein 1-like [Gorilla gorilla gorilla]|uniref:putative POM121-like protein 1-like n=1 Tax=Gorilla gorilla gorilla TaxID=9595 RepID=UPI00300B8ABF